MKMKVKGTGLLIWVLAILANQVSSQSLYFPPKTGTWETTTPESLGWCTSEIDSLYDFLSKGDSKAFIVLKDGKMVLEKYFGAFTKDSLWYWASAGKTLTAMAVGIAAKEGYLKLTDTSSKYLGKGWSSLSAAQEAKITVWHHITMTTGLDDAAGDADCTDKSCLVYKADPGTRWAYHNAPYTLIDQIISGATGQNLNTFISSKIKTTTGMDGLYIKTGYNNVYFSTPRSMARYGLLLQNSGNWNGTAVLGDSVYFKQMTQSSQNINLSYGYLTWLNGKSSFMVPQSQFVFPGSLMPDAPADMFCALGKNSQYINVAPSKGIVLVRMGNNPPQGGGLVPTTFDNNIWKYMNKIMCNSSTIATEKPAIFQVFPNPADEKIRIQSNEIIKTCTLYSLSGSAISAWENIAELDVSHVAKGVYVLEINGENKLEKIKIIIN